MKQIIFSIIMFASAYTHAQKAWVYSEAKNGKVSYKECIGVSVSDTLVTFVVTGTTYQQFRAVGVSYSGETIWMDCANGKQVHFTCKGNTKVWWKTSKKGFLVE